MNKGKFIITDPCYIMDEKQYDKICELEDCNFEGQKFPLISKHKETGKDIIFHIIKNTPNGDGGYTYKEQRVGVDSGMLCITECESGWDDDFGATFDTLSEAKRAFPWILIQF